MVPQKKKKKKLQGKFAKRTWAEFGFNFLLFALPTLRFRLPEPLVDEAKALQKVTIVHIIQIKRRRQCPKVQNQIAKKKSKLESDLESDIESDL